MDPAEDDRAPGGAITTALCGSSDHEPPCPAAAHHIRAERSGDEIRLRVLFASEPDDEQWVRRTIDDALAGGAARWRLVSSATSTVRPAEQDHAARLTRG